MKRGGGEPGADAASRLLRMAVRLLPAGRREWGLAMQAELAQIGSGPARLRFALSCLRGSLIQPALIGMIGYPLLMLALIAGVVAWTGRVTYVPLRGALIGLAAILAALSWLARWPGLLGPVGEGRTARLVRAGGYALVGSAALVIIHSLRLANGNLAAKTQIEVPVCATALAIYTVAFAAMTARRSAAGVPVLAIGGGCAIAAGALWLIPVLALPPVPTSNAGALALVAAAGCAAALVSTAAIGGSAVSTAAAGGSAVGGSAEPTGTRPSDRTRPRPDAARYGPIIAGLCAAAATALLIFVAADGLLQFFPHWVANSSPPNVPAAGRLANNRDGDEDGWFFVLFVGFLLAATLSAVAVATRRPGPGPAGTLGAPPDPGSWRRLRTGAILFAGRRGRPHAQRNGDVHGVRPPEVDRHAA